MALASEGEEAAKRTRRHAVSAVEFITVQRSSTR